jgi:uncharacterized protein
MSRPKFLEPAKSLVEPMLVNAHTGEVIARTVELARTRATRRRGLLGRTGLPPGSALAITLCKAVHTIGMKFTIDVVFVDSTGTVRTIVKALKPRRIAVSPMASVAIECESGALPLDSLRIGDRLYLAPNPEVRAAQTSDRRAEVGSGIVAEFQH